MKTMDQLFTGMLQDIYFAEKQLLKDLRKLGKASTNPTLKQAFEDHRAETETHVERLEQVFELLGKRARGKRCDAIMGISEEAAEVVEEAEDNDVRDAGIIGAAQAAEHYEIARYGTLCAWAELQGLTEVKAILGQTLAEEKNADLKLSKLAYGGINDAALNEAA